MILRFFDIVFSSLALIILCPLLVPIAFLLRFTGEGEIFYRQRRIGKSGTEFFILKFATMLKNSPNMGSGTVTLAHDPRVLPVGKMLRATKINELPQLLNVLLGDMSLIGPRPQTLECFSHFPLNMHDEILSLRPGLSGIGSIIYRDEESILAEQEDPIHYYNHVLMPNKALIEVWYVRNINFKNYALLIWYTLLAVVNPRSAILCKFIEKVKLEVNIINE